jgi:hypothetical protein
MRALILMLLLFGGCASAPVSPQEKVLADARSVERSRWWMHGWKAADYWLTYYIIDNDPRAREASPVLGPAIEKWGLEEALIGAFILEAGLNEFTWRQSMKCQREGGKLCLLAPRIRISVSGGAFLWNLSQFLAHRDGADSATEKRTRPIKRPPHKRQRPVRPGAQP